ncbi:TPA: hypothetical protein EYP66_24320 [Candidatus Poribacteria bacterium]|nr:hypothetical protein [Candidatus Poribacteria bacterium]
MRRSYGRQPPLPKPYEFVKIDEMSDEHRCHPKGHEDYGIDKISGELKGEITTLSPVHVASGMMELTGRRDFPLVKAHTSHNGRPIIPGSSLKGAIRSIVEAISPSCVRITRLRSNQLPNNTSACKNKKSLCVSCRMFGAMDYLGQVRFSDAVLQQGYTTEIAAIPSLYSPRTREGLYFDDSGNVKGRKFYQHGNLAEGNVPIEVCPVNAKFDFILSFDNLTEGELGLLLIALGLGTPKFYPKLGGAKPACCGTLEITIPKSQIFEDIERAYLQYDVEPTDIDIPKYIDAAQEIVLNDQLQQLADILKLDEQRQCPDRNY